MKGDVAFVVRNHMKWMEILTANTRPSIRDIRHMFVSNEDIWIVLTYLQLRRRGAKIQISSQPIPGRINIVDGIHLDPEHTRPDVFLVGCRGDGHYPALCDIVLHQNTLRLPGQRSIHVPQWIQPGIAPRDGNRRDVRTIGFLGHAAVNLHRAFHTAAMREALASKGYDLVIRDRDGCPQWHDYSDIDLTLCVRDIPYEHLRLKPANKLINSWYARTPTIIGREPAIRALRRSDLDYFELQSPEQIFDCLTLFRSQPSLYRKMVEHGSTRALQFSDDAVSGCWLKALRLIRRRYLLWERSAAAELDLTYQTRLKLHARALLRHKRTVHDAYYSAGFQRDWWDSRLPPDVPAF